jgi:hypothetical protein
MMANDKPLTSAAIAPRRANPSIQRQDPEKDFRWFVYDDYGLDLYSNAAVADRTDERRHAPSA